MVSWLEKISDLQMILGSLSIRSHLGEEIEVEAGFNQWVEMTCTVREKRRTVYLIGNGASASMASHVSADLAKNAHVHTEVFSDLSLITAMANDLGFEEVFAEPLRRRVEEGDMLVAISSSGQSPNIIHACKETRRRGGVIITLSAMDSENRLRKEGVINFYLPARTYGMAETGHAAILHHWLDQMVLRRDEAEWLKSIKGVRRFKRVEIHG